MNVEALFLKTAHGSRAVACKTLHLKRGVGIEGDVNAIAGSPRQVLWVSRPVLDRFGLQPGQLQENGVLDGAVEAFCSGQVVQMGESALIRMTTRCEPCAMLNTIAPGLAKRLNGHRGMLGMVVRDGVVRLGDRVVLTPYQLPTIPEDTPSKFAEFVGRIPQGMVVPTADLLLALGLTRSYYRVIPRWIKHAPAHLPVHRIVSIQGTLLTSHLPDQAQLLQAEGVTVVDQVVPPSFYWQALQFHELGTW